MHWFEVFSMFLGGGPQDKHQLKQCELKAQKAWQKYHHIWDEHAIDTPAGAEIKPEKNKPGNTRSKNAT
eukprot:6465422-Amphidinium_carterae.1